MTIAFDDPDSLCMGVDEMTHNQMSLFKSSCCGADLVSHWPCDERAKCSACGECAVCDENFEAEVMPAAEKHADEQARRRRNAR